MRIFKRIDDTVSMKKTKYPPSADAVPKKRGRKPKPKPATPELSIRAAQKELLLQRIHDAARELFYTQGYATTTFDQIATASGARRSTLYKYFRDKEDILRMITERYGERLLEVSAQLPGPVPTRAQSDAWILETANFIRRERTPTVLINSLAMGDYPVPATMDLGLRIVQRLAENVRAFRYALEPGPRQGLAFAKAMILMREVSLCALHRAREGDSEFIRNLFQIVGDFAEEFFHEHR